MEGTAGSTVSLDDEWVGVSVGSAAEAVATKLSSGFEKTVSASDSVSEEGLSLFFKLALGGVIVAACVVFVKAYAPQRAGIAGRHGAYEKAGV